MKEAKEASGYTTAVWLQIKIISKLSFNDDFVNSQTDCGMSWSFKSCYFFSDANRTSSEKKMVTWMQLEKNQPIFYLRIIKDLVWKSSHNRAILEQGIKSSWSAGVCAFDCS